LQLDIWIPNSDELYLERYWQPVKQMHELVPGEDPPTPVDRSIAPHKQIILELKFGGEELPNPTLPFWLRGWVDYVVVTNLLRHGSD
jgi:hypothetical protein